MYYQLSVLNIAILTVLTDAGVEAALCLVVRMLRALYQVLDLLAGGPEDDPGAGLPHPGRVDPGNVDLVCGSALWNIMIALSEKISFKSLPPQPLCVLSR